VNLYKKNLEYLRRSRPVLYHQIAGAPVAFPAKTTLLPETANAVVSNGQAECNVVSLYNRDRELAAMFADVPADTRVIILFGLGTGNALDHIAAQFPSLERLVVIEPNLDLFRYFLQCNDLGSAFGRFGKVSLIVNQSMAETKYSLADLVNTERYRSLELVAPIAYRTLYADYYKGVFNVVLDLVRAIHVNVSTRSYYAFRWLVNAWRNERQPSIDIEHLLDRLPPLPVIIVSAGPSLNNNIRLLAEARQKAVIIAVGSAMTILTSHGITPHFNMAIDGHERNKKLFAAVDTTACPLIYTDGLYHEVLPAYRGPVIHLVMENDHIARYLRHKQQKKTMPVASGFSVANVALNFACKWGCPKIILMGQDLCYTKKKAYASGAWDEQDPSKKLNYEEMAQVKNIFGEDVYTDNVFLAMKMAFERTCAHYPQLRFINASEGGLAINGIDNMPLRQVLDKELTDTYDIDGYIGQALQDCQPMDRQSSAEVIVTGIAAELEAMLAIQKKCLRDLQEISTGEFDAGQLSAAVRHVDRQLDEIRRMEFFREVLCWYFEDQLNVAKSRCATSHADPVIRAKAEFEQMHRETIIIGDFASFTKGLVDEFLGRRKMNILYEQ
jgi:hypothetical protein